jgi:DNA transposition AAA+ family ATPase
MKKPRENVMEGKDETTAKKENARPQLKPIFLHTRNVRNFQMLLDGLMDSPGEGRLGMVYGQAGRGKSRTAIFFTAAHGWPYLPVSRLWRTSEVEFLRALCREVGIKHPPVRKGPCFGEIVEKLLANPVPVVLDEFDKLTQDHLEIVRELSDFSGAPFVLVGEEELAPFMRRNRRVWSRTFEKVEYAPIEPAEIMKYFAEAAGLALEPQDAFIIQKRSGGDFRPVKRAAAKLLTLARGGSVDKDMIKTVLKMDLWGGE